MLLARELRRMVGVPMEPEDFDRAKVPTTSGSPSG